MNELLTYFSTMLTDFVEKIVISKPNSKRTDFQKIVVEKKSTFFQIAKYTEKQVLHENVECSALCQRCVELTDGHFLQVNGWTQTHEHMVLISKKGTISFKKRPLTQPESAPSATTHNRKKQYILEEGTFIAPLIDMGVFTKEGKVVQSMYDKYRQINRFVEILDDELKDSTAEVLNIIDFGCGKSYLTFIVYYYLTEIKHIKANIIGLDLKADVIEKCTISAKKYGYDGLHFELGDINGFQAPFPVDIVITLHACDTATDYALYNAICWKAKMIFSVPCCQHELNGQIAPKSLSLLSHYGIIKERFSALSTDAMRGNLLEYSGYKTQLLEFIDLTHTPKNILIRAVRQPLRPKKSRAQSLQEVETAMAEFGFQPTLYALLGLGSTPEET